MKPTFSAIIPSYNSSGFVSRAIDSALNQSYPPAEVLVLDDGSTDSTREVVQAYGDKIRYFALPHSGCVGLVRNRGILESCGDYLAFLDADDAWYPNKLEEMARAIEAHPDSGLFYSNFDFVDEDLRFLYRARCENLSGFAYKRLLKRTPVANSSVVVNRECFSSCGLFSESLAAPGCEDWEMWVRISRKFPFVYLPLALCEYTLHKRTESLSRTENWVGAQTYVVEMVLADDPNLTPRERESVRAWALYRQGRYRMMRGQNHAALSCFRKTMRQHPFHLRSWLFFTFLRINSTVPFPAGWCRWLGLSANPKQNVTE